MRRIAILVLFSASAAYAASTPSYTASQFTFSGTPNSVTLGSDGNIWLIDRSANKIGKLTPDGTYTTFSIPTASAIAVGITLGPDGNAWFAEFGPTPNKIGRVTPDGAITEFSLPAGKSLGSLAAGPDGNVWYTESTSSNGPPVYSLGHISTVDGSMNDFALPANGRAQALVTGSDGNLWIGWVESSGTKYDVLRVTPTGTSTTFALPSITASNALGATMLLGPDFNIWFTYQNNLARVKPEGTVTLYPIPTANANMLPAGLDIGMDGNIWFTEFSSGKLGQLVVSTATDSGQATINESDVLGALPQTIFNWPFPKPAMGKTGALGNPPPPDPCKAPVTSCPKQNFLIVGQTSTTSPPDLRIAEAPNSPLSCADIKVASAVVSNPNGGSVQFNWISNLGPDSAKPVRSQTDFIPLISGLTASLFSQMAECQQGLSSSGILDVACTWPQIDPGTPSKTVSLKLSVTGSNAEAVLKLAAYSPIPDPCVKNNFDKRILTTVTRGAGLIVVSSEPSPIRADHRGH